MELLHLRYFKAVVDYGTVTKAANELYVAQPAISKIIKNLEIELGVELFDREGRKIKLNENGRVFLDYVNNILSLAESAVLEMDYLNKRHMSLVRFIPQATNKFIPEIASEFIKKYPYIKLQITQLDPSFINVKETDYDIILKVTSSTENNSNNLYLTEEKIMVAVHKGHYLYDNNFVSIKDIQNEKMITYLPFNKFRKRITELCRNEGFYPNIILEIDATNTIKKLVEKGFGIAFIPSYTWDLSDSDIKLLPVNNSKFSRHLSIEIPEGKGVSPATLLFRDFLVEFYKNKLI